MNIQDKINSLNCILLINSKEWNSNNIIKSLKDREIYWSFRDRIYTFDYLCPKTGRIWLKDNKSGYNNHQDTNALSEMYLINL